MLGSRICFIMRKQSILYTYCDETKRRALKLQTELMKKPSWATVGPAKDKQQALTNQLKFYARVVIESDVWPILNFMHFWFYHG